MEIGNFNFSIIELKFEPVERDYFFYGSYYRGMLGRYLKRRFCILKNMECQLCPIKDKCLYMLSFEKYEDVLFPPYVINRAERDRLRVVFVGSFSEFSEVYLEGFSKNLKPFEAGYFDPFENKIRKDKVIINSRQIAQFKIKKDEINLIVRFARIKKDSKLINCEDINEKVFFDAIERRIYLINKYYGNSEFPVFLPDKKPFFELKNCRYHKIKRYSNRKKRSMQIPTATFGVKLRANAEEIYPFLYLSNFLNIGSNASMGFGVIELDE